MHRPAAASLLPDLPVVRKVNGHQQMTITASTRLPMGTTMRGLALAVLLAGTTMVSAQNGREINAQETMKIDEQPGYEPSPDEEQLPAVYQHQMVFFRTTEAPGTIVIQTSERFLYVVQGNNRAMRYGIGVGRDGFQWGGQLKITRKVEWPDWTPPPEMIQRQPYLPRFMAGGPGNPMGARALYLGTTVYRIHGTNQPQTIGQSISSGCFRLANGEIADLYARIPVGTRVVVKQAPDV
jgi:lipoprotein-anchoring transpeptidase ErfK/SrfK